jgi:hypothetical protein
MRHRGLLVAGAAAIALASTGAPSPAQEGDGCAEVVYLSTVEAAPQATMLNQGQDVPVPAAYARVEHETSPAFTYADAGSASFGLLEGMEVQPRDVVALLTGFLPVPLPEGLLPDPPETGSTFTIPTPPGRATAAHPVESIPEEDEASWGSGRSEARATATGAHAATRTTGASGAPTGGSTAVASSALACERLELHATWSIDAAGTGSAATGTIRQELRAVLHGDRVPEVELVTLAGDEALGGALWQLPVGPLSELFEAFGQDFEVREPEVEVGPGLLRVRSNPVLWSMNNPSGPQRIELAAGHLLVEARFLGLAPDLDGGGILAGDVTGGTIDGAAPGAPGGDSATGDVGAPAVQAGPPGAAGTAEVGMAPIGTTGQVIDLSRPLAAWGWLATLAAVLAGAWAWWRLALARGDRWPTAAWTFRLVDRRTERFRAAFLRW